MLAGVGPLEPEPAPTVAAAAVSADRSAVPPLTPILESNESETATVTTPVAAAAAAPAPANPAADLDDGQMLWKCEFCGHRNVVLLDAEEIPREESLDYILPGEGGGGAGGDASPAAGAEDTSLVVFCIDISGSMCVTTEVEGKFDLK